MGSEFRDVRCPALHYVQEGTLAGLSDIGNFLVLGSSLSEVFSLVHLFSPLAG